MKVLGLVAEYNPFHYGHEYHIRKSKESLNIDYVVAIMSGSFVQRGEPALVDKWTRAKMALDSGLVDLVIELPFIYASQGAELFSYGSIKILNDLNIIDYLSFGSEAGDLAGLDKIARILVDSPRDFKKILEREIEINNSFPLARERALIEYTQDRELEKLLAGSNNILAIEYLKALYRLDSKIKPFTLKRQGADYGDQDLRKNFSSATSIRRALIREDLASIEPYLPDYSLGQLKAFWEEYRGFNSLYNYEDLLYYKLRKSDPFFPLDDGQGLLRRLTNKSEEIFKMEDLIDSTVSKTHVRTRIQRLIIHLLHDLNKEDITRLVEEDTPYIRVLASNKKGFQLLARIKKESSLELINKFRDYPYLEESLANPTCLYYDKLSTDLYFLGLDKKKYNMDYYTSPYIKK